MKFYTLLALVASAAAIRVTQVSTPQPSNIYAKAVSKLLSPHQLLELKEEQCICEWIKKEVNSDDGLTWEEWKAKI